LNAMIRNHFGSSLFNLERLGGFALQT